MKIHGYLKFLFLSTFLCHVALSDDCLPMVFDGRQVFKTLALSPGKSGLPEGYGQFCCKKNGKVQREVIAATTIGCPYYKENGGSIVFAKIEETLTDSNLAKKTEELNEVVHSGTTSPGLSCKTSSLPLTGPDKESDTYLGERPDHIQREVDIASENIKSQTGSGWAADGGVGFYNIMQLDEEKLIREIASRDDGQKDVYLMDVGAGYGAWGMAVEKLLKKEFAQSSKRFHIISVTGGSEQPTETRADGNITHHRFNKFKIEDIAKELAEKGFDVSNKIDLIVSRWTLRHLVDPMGTLKQLYSLLKPKTGMLMANGFMLANGANIKTHVQNTVASWNLLNSTSAKTLFLSNDAMRNLDDFLMIRPDERPLNVPLKYISTTELDPTLSYQCFSYRVCRFEDSSLFQKKLRRIYRNNEGYFSYRYYGGKTSSEVLEDLIKRDLFVENIKPKRHVETEYGLQTDAVKDKMTAKRLQSLMQIYKFGKADILNKNNHGQNSVSLAAQVENWEVMRFLAHQAPAALLIPDTFGSTALQYAKDFDAPNELILELTQLAKDPLSKLDHLAGNKLDTTDRLQRNVIDKSLTIEDIQDAIEMVKRKQQKEIGKSEVENPILNKNKNGQNSVSLAAQVENWEVMQFLAHQAPAALFIPDTFGFTALQYAEYFNAPKELVLELTKLAKDSSLLK